MTVVLTLGTFDMLHPGHVDLLARCRELAGPFGIVVAAANPDAFVERFKGRRPVQSLEDRLEMLEACRYVDRAVANVGEEQALRVIDTIRPSLLVIGDDWAPPRDYLGQLHVTQEQLDERGIRIEYVPRVRAYSTTAYRAAVLA